jgi:hypothetical protein
LGVERVDSARNSLHALNDGVGVADAATGRLASTSRVVNRLGGSACVSAEDQINDGSGGAITWRCGSFTGTEDVNRWALSLRK